MRSENERRSLHEILNRVKEGRIYDSAGIWAITRNLMNCRGLELLREDMPDDMSNEEWYEELCISADMPVMERTYNYIVLSLSMKAEKEGINDETLMFLSSLFFLAGKAVKPYMGIAVEDLLREAELNFVYDVWFKSDAELFRELKGRAVTVKDVLKNCFEMYESAEIETGRKPSKVIFGLTPVTQDDIGRPFVRIRRRGAAGRDDERMISECFFVWVWTLMVLAPINVLHPEQG